MPKHVFQFECPCCGDWIEVDTRSGKARAVDPTAGQKAKNLDTLLADHESEDRRLGSAFDEAKREQARQAERLDDILAKAAKAAKQDKKRPRNPFDLE